MHTWGDEWFKNYGNDLYEAEKFIYSYVYKWSRCRLMSKEKWGQLRYERIFPPFSSYRFGPHLYIPYFRKTIRLQNKEVKDCKIFIWIWNCSWLHAKWCRFGYYVLTKAVKKAIKKWPHLEKELTVDLNWRYND